MSPSTLPSPEVDVSGLVGEFLGRYEVLELVGQGGMGAVFRGHDPELDREVAIKVLRPGRGDPDESRDAHARLLREAQALARLSHPNVVQVFDAGRAEVEGHAVVFIAMEFVEGQTLSGWLEEDRPLEAILDVFVAAGRGLAAAHAQGLVHRDFKPANVMIDEAGTAKVMDFGLARVWRSTEDESLRSGRSHDTGSGVSSELDVSSKLTEAGVVMGTPVYMAPEQHAGAEVDARADVFAFSVALFQAVTGQRPYHGRLQELASAKLAGPPAFPPQPPVPRAVQRAITRGLQPRADDRFADMTAMVEALRPARRPWLVVAGLGGLGLAAAVVVVSHPDDEADPCASAEKRVEDVWDVTHRERAGAAFESADDRYGAEAWDRASKALDTYADAWARAYESACTAGRAGSLDPADLDRTMRCLDDRHRRLQATIGIFEEANARVVQRSATSVALLPDVAGCDDLEALRATLAPPSDPRVAEQVERVRDIKVQVLALRELGDWKEVQKQVEQGLSQARATGYDPIIAEMLYLRGEAERLRGELEPAMATFQESHDLAVECGHERTAVLAAAALALVSMSLRGDDEAARQWIRIGQVALARLGDDARLESQLVYLEAALAQSRGDLDEALKFAQRSLVLREEALGPRHPVTMVSVNTVANILDGLGRADEALVMYERALETMKELGGPNHPDVASLQTNIALTKYGQGRLDEALADAQEAMEVRQRIFPEDHPDITNSLLTLGEIHAGLGHHEAALRYFRRALARFEKAYGPEHRHVAGTIDNIGVVLRRMGRYEASRQHHERAVAILESIVGKDHPDLAMSLHNLAMTVQAEGDLELARTHYARALRILEAAHGPDHPHVASELYGLAECDLAEGQREAALGKLERAHRIHEKTPSPDPAEAALTEFLLAKALRPDDEARARELGQTARDAFDRLGPVGEDDKAKVEAWLAQRSRG